MTVQPGDCLGYGVSGWSSYLTHPFEQAVQTKTWSPIYHVEIYAGAGQALSADWRGVDFFPANAVWPSDPAHLYCVLRPSEFDVARALRWFEVTARGHAYDARGLLRFYAISTGDRNAYFCSDLAAQVYRAGGMRVFNEVDSKTVAPGMFLRENAFRRIWTRGDQEVVTF